jgi:hypothetical protein
MRGQLPCSLKRVYRWPTLPVALLIRVFVFVARRIFGIDFIAFPQWMEATFNTS